MLTEYSISEIIVSNPKASPFYIGTFEGTEDPNVKWPHRHNFYSLVWFTYGTGTNVIDFEEYNIQPDRLFLMLPKQVHNWSYSKDTNGYVLVFDKHFLQRFPLELVNSVFFDLKPRNIKLLKTLFEQLMEELKIKDKLSKELITSGINFILLNLIRLSNHPKQSHKTKPAEIFNFSKLISETISNNLSVTDYANKLHITVEKLNELCKESYGQNPKAIIIDRKITEAKRLLYFTGLTIKEIAYQLGFEDSSYFSRVFKQKTSFSPSDFKSKSA